MHNTHSLSLSHTHTHTDPCGGVCGATGEGAVVGVVGRLTHGAQRTLCLVTLLRPGSWSEGERERERETNYNMKRT